MGLFSWISQKMTTNTIYPTIDDSPRLQAYSKYENIYLGQVAALDGWIDRVQTGDPFYSYVSNNLSRSIVDLYSQMLFAKPPSITATQQEYLDRLVFDNDLWSELLKAALNAHTKGDALLKISWDGAKPVVQSVDPTFWRPITDKRNPSKAVGGVYYLAVGDEDNGDSYFLEETYLPGQISYRAFVRENGKTKAQVSLDRFEADHPGLLPRDENGVIGDTIQLAEPVQLLIHIPNWQLDSSVYGLSTLAALEPLQCEYNRRLSDLGRYLSQVSWPWFVVPEYLLQSDGTGTPKLDPRNSVLTARKPEDADTFKVVEPQADLGPSFKQLDLLRENMLLVSQTSPAAVGLDKGGTSISGRSRYFSMLSSLLNISAKQNRWQNALQKVFYSCMQLERLLGDSSVKPEIVQLKWADDLVSDRTQDIADTISELEAGVISMETARAKLGHDNAEEVARLVAERSPAPIGAQN